MRVLASEEDSLAAQHRSRVQQRRGRFISLLETTVAEVASEPVPGGPTIDPRVAAGCIRTMVEGVVDWYDPDGPLEREALVGRVVHLALSALESRMSAAA